jgi:hypothetical protein
MLEVEAKIMAEENRIMLLDLATITDPVQKNLDREEAEDDLCSRRLKDIGIDECHLGESSHFLGETCHFLNILNIL